MATIRVPLALRIFSNVDHLKILHGAAMHWFCSVWLLSAFLLHFSSPGHSSQFKARDQNFIDRGAFILQSRGETPDQAAIRRVLEEQVNAWNEGSIEKYMQGYWKSDSLVFTSNGKITRGWKTTLERYKRAYGTRELMGALSFSDLEITVLDETTAWVLGKWRLLRKKDTPHGIFTLVLRRFPDGWKIIHDHTSLEP